MSQEKEDFMILDWSWSQVSESLRFFFIFTILEFHLTPDVILRLIVVVKYILNFESHALYIYSVALLNS